MPPESKPRTRTLWLIVSAYVAALVVVSLTFVAWRVVVHHRTFAGRSFFWLGDVYVNDDAIGFRMGPNRNGIAVLHHGVEDPARRIPVRTDAFGLRIPLAGPADAAAPGGIAAIGCSCTFGHGVAAESTYVALAGEILHLPASNLGVCSYSGVTSLLLLEQHAPRLRPAIVVYGCGNFHLERAARSRIDGTVRQAHAVAVGNDVRIAPPPFGNRRSFQASHRIEALYYRARLDGRTIPLTPSRIATVLPLAFEELGRVVQPASWRERGAPAPLPEAAYYRLLLERMHAASAAQGARFVLFFFPAFFGEQPAPELAAVAAEFADRPGFLFLDCGPALFDGVAAQAEYSARWQVPRDGHPNRFMHLEMARILAGALEPAIRQTP